MGFNTCVTCNFERYTYICVFLSGIPVYGKDIMTVIDQPFDIQDMLNVSPQGKRTVVYEARYLKALFLKLQMS